MLLALILAATSASLSLAGGTNENKRLFSPILYSHEIQNEFGFPLSQNLKTTRLSRRFVGGKFVNSSAEYPFMALIYKRYIKNVKVTLKFCAGVILNKRHVLTAAHCLCDPCVMSGKEGEVCAVRDPENYFVRTGRMKYPFTIWNRLGWQVQQILLHPDFVNERYCQFKYDFAIIRLVENIYRHGFAEKIQSVGLPQTSWQAPDQWASTNCVMLGYDRTSTAAGRTVMRLKSSRVFFSDSCHKLHFVSNETGVCTVTREVQYRELNSHKLNGDPIVCDGVVVGIGSYTFHKFLPYRQLLTTNVHSRVDKAVVDWILEIIIDYTPHLYYNARSGY